MEVTESNVFGLVVCGAGFSEDYVKSLCDVALAAVVAANDDVFSFSEAKIKLSY
jgi:hypothetical protein